jgi:hypothetical protein
MATRHCPHCHRRIVRDQRRCCYCGQESRAHRPRGAAQVFALDGTRLDAADVAAVSVHPPTLADESSSGGTLPVRETDGPPNDAGDIARLGTHPAARWAFTLIVTTFALALGELIVPTARGWLEPARMLLGIAAQSLLLSTPYHAWSVRLMHGAFFAVLIPRRPITGLHEPGLQLYLLLLFLSLQLAIVGLWRHWRHAWSASSTRAATGDAIGNDWAKAANDSESDDAQ